LLDPVVGRHRRSFAPLSEALSDLRPRLRGYAEAATLLKATREIGHA
jgi:hypothetical protein